MIIEHLLRARHCVYVVSLSPCGACVGGDALPILQMRKLEREGTAQPQQSS